jgi:RNA polymerase sigma factor (sigma-70 family)
MNDERLARRAAAGDKAAFEAIFRRYHQDLYRYCLATVGNPQDAQDALQNTMVKALQSLPGERREIKLKPWLYRVARNESIETLRRRREGVELDADREASNWEIAESAATRERLRQLFADLEELPERQRSALVMREMGGLDFDEIGASFGTSPAVVRQTLYEARLSLRQMDEGREMSCETVMKALSDADGRVTRRRDLRAHLRGCASCRAFRGEIAERRGELAAIAPLPLALSAGLLEGVIGSQAGASAASAAGAAAASGAGAGTGGLAGTVGAGIGKTVAGATIAKSAATVAVVAVVGVSAADRGGVVDLPFGGEATEAKRALERRSPVANERSAEPVVPGQQVGAGRPRAEAEPLLGRQRAEGDPSPGATGKARRAAAGTNGRRLRPAAPGRSQAAPARGRLRGNPGRGRSQARSPAAPPKSPPPTSSRGQGSAGARKPAPTESPPAAATSPPPKPEQPTNSEGATLAPAPASEAPEAETGGSASKGVGSSKVESIRP